MRKVSIDRLTPDMRLARTVDYKNTILIREGTTNLDRYRDRLDSLGIYSLYIEDSVSGGIELEEIVSDKTRSRCKETLYKTIEKLKSSLLVDRGEVRDSVESLLEEMIARPHVLISMSDIGRTDDNTLEHSINTTIYAAYLGMQRGYSRNKLSELAEGTLLHDLGKTLLDRKILFKPDHLSAEEFEHIKTHPKLGYELLQRYYGMPEPARQIALCHHERLDGSGYPFGMAGKEVSEEVRIAAIADVYEALTADRCYRDAILPSHALEVLSGEAANKLDLNLVSLFLKSLAIYPNGTSVWLSDGSEGVVVRQNPLMPLRPVVRIVVRDGKELMPLQEVDLMEVLNLTIVD